MRQDALEDGDATQTEVNAAHDALEAAVKGLVSVNKSSLKDLYDANKNKTNENYTEDSWAAFQTALSDAKSALENGDASQSEVDEKYAALVLAIDNLKEGVNKELLSLAIEQGEAEDTSGCTPSSVKRLEEALAEGRKVLENDSATQKQVDDAVSAIHNALTGLTNRADTERLEELLESVGKLVENEYTSASWQTLSGALSVAEEVMEDADATQAEVDAALAATGESCSRPGEATGVQ